MGGRPGRKRAVRHKRLQMVPLFADSQEEFRPHTVHGLYRYRLRENTNACWEKTFLNDSGTSIYAGTKQAVSQGVYIYTRR